MDLGSTVKLLLRRWWVIVIGIALTAGATYFLHSETKPRYQATANMILLLQPDARGAESGPGNPFLYLPNGLVTLAGIVVVGPESREFRQAMYANGLTSQFEIGVQVASPILRVTVEGSDPANVIATRDAVVQGLRDELVRVQAEEKTPAKQTAHARVYDSEEIPSPVQGDSMRGLLMTVAVGGLITLIAAFVIDRLASLMGARRRRRRDARERSQTGPDDAVRSVDLSDSAATSTDEADSRQERRRRGRAVVDPDGASGVPDGDVLVTAADALATTGDAKARASQ